MAVVDGRGAQHSYPHYTALVPDETPFEWTRQFHANDLCTVDRRGYCALVHLVGDAMKHQPASNQHAEIRDLRRWEEEPARLYGIFERAYQNTALHEAAIDLCRKTLNNR